MEGELEILECHFERNKASRSGGCLSLKGDRLRVTVQSTIATGNTARKGAVFAATGSPRIFLDASRFSNNEANMEGGVILWEAQVRPPPSFFQEF